MKDCVLSRNVTKLRSRWAIEEFVQSRILGITLDLHTKQKIENGVAFFLGNHISRSIGGKMLQYAGAFLFVYSTSISFAESVLRILTKLVILVCSCEGQNSS